MPEPGHRLRIVYLGHVARLSGGELALSRLLPALHDDVDPLVILAEDGPLVAVLREAGVPVEVLPLAVAARDVRKDEVGTALSSLRGAWLTACYAVRLARRLRQLRPDLVHTNTLKAGFYGSIAGRLARVPVVWHVRDRIADDYLPARAVWLTRSALALLPTAVLCNSQATLGTIGPGATRSGVVASPVVYDPYETAMLVPQHVGSFVVAMVGRLAPWKGQELFLRAFARAFPMGAEQARVVGSAMFGEDDYAASLATLVAELGLGPRAQLVGFTDQVEWELARADVLVHASLTPEPFGQVVIEGMAAGLPVIAADAGGPAEVITSGTNGLLVPMGDLDAVADAMLLLRHDPALRQRLGAAARESARAFSPDAIGAQVVRFYRSVLDRDDHPKAAP